MMEMMMIRGRPCPERRPHAGNPAAAVPDEHGDVDGDDAGKTLAQGVVIHNGFFIHPLVVLDDFPPQNRQHGVTAAEGHGAHAEKQGW